MIIYHNTTHTYTMKIIQAPTLKRAHELAIKTVLEKGYIVKSENNEMTIEYDSLCLVVQHPLTDPMFSDRSRFKQEFLTRYTDNLIKGCNNTFEYDYHERLFAWGDKLTHAGRYVTTDQIRYIIEKLSRHPESRRALAVTWIPSVDETREDVPCLQLVQCAIRDNVLNMKVVFRSNDILSAAGSNMYALVYLQKHIADALNVNVGTYEHIALIPHIYYCRDVDDIHRFCDFGKEIKPNEIVCSRCGLCKPHNS